jgi:hypothetical protein
VILAAAFIVALTVCALVIPVVLFLDWLGGGSPDEDQVARAFSDWFWKKR